MASSDPEIEQETFEWFARAHPHEAYEMWPERFWDYIHREAPSVSREQMEQLLKET